MKQRSYAEKLRTFDGLPPHRASILSQINALNVESVRKSAAGGPPACPRFGSQATIKGGSRRCEGRGDPYKERPPLTGATRAQASQEKEELPCVLPRGEDCRFEVSYSGWTERFLRSKATLEEKDVERHGAVGDVGV